MSFHESRGLVAEKLLVTRFASAQTDKKKKKQDRNRLLDAEDRGVVVTEGAGRVERGKGLRSTHWQFQKGHGDGTSPTGMQAVTS